MTTTTTVAALTAVSWPPLNHMPTVVATQAETSDVKGLGDVDDAGEEVVYSWATAFVIEGVLLAVVAVFGLTGNAAAIVAFSRQRVQRNFHALMLALCAYDSTYIVVSLLLFALPQFSDSYTDSGAYFRLLPWTLPLAQIGLSGSIYLTVAITLERYFTVCHPFFRVSHAWPAKLYIAPIVTLSVLYNIPKFFELRTRYPSVRAVSGFVNGSSEAVFYDADDPAALDDIYESLSRNDSLSVERVSFGIRPTDLRLDKAYVKVYCIWMNLLLNGILPFMTLIVLNALILRRLKALSKESPIDTRRTSRSPSR
jgi:hypothetical protein